LCDWCLDPTRPDAENLVPDGDLLTEDMVTRRKNEQYRLCAYRSLIFWAYPYLTRNERRPLPACIYDMVRTMFPSSADEEVNADWQHSVFTFELSDR